MPKRVVKHNKTGSKATLKLVGTYYACTLKYNAKVGKKEEQLSKLLNFIKLFPYSFMEIHHELDSSDNHHYHGIFKGPRNLTYKNLMKKNYHVYIRPIYEYDGWQDYIKKEQTSIYRMKLLIAKYIKYCNNSPSSIFRPTAGPFRKTLNEAL